jgi:hypothetical protein
MMYYSHNSGVNRASVKQIIGKQFISREKRPIFYFWGAL